MNKILYIVMLMGILISCSDSWEMTEQEINTQNVITIQWEGVVEDTQWVSTTDNPSYEIITQ